MPEAWGTDYFQWAVNEELEENPTTLLFWLRQFQLPYLRRLQRPERAGGECPALMLGRTGPSGPVGCPICEDDHGFPDCPQSDGLVRQHRAYFKCMESGHTRQECSRTIQSAMPGQPSLPHTQHLRSSDVHRNLAGPTVDAGYGSGDTTWGGAHQERPENPAI